MKNIKIVKLTGEIESFDEKKVRASIIRLGVNEKTVGAVLAVVKKKLRAGMSTRDIHKIIRSELRRRQPGAAAKYNLRAAIIRMGPAGYNFEKYIASIFAAYGYKTVVPDTYRGACVSHEVDVTAEKDSKRAFIEAKFRKDFEDSIGIKDTMSTWARFLDLVDGAKQYKSTPHFDEAWLVTNARFSDQSLAYGKCKGMQLFSWKTPKERTLSDMVDVEALYPITVLHGLSSYEIEQFARAGVVLCKDVARISLVELRKKVKLQKRRLEEIVWQCENIVGNT